MADHKYLVYRLEQMAQTPLNYDAELIREAIAALSQPVAEAVERDAERYRWLRECDAVGDTAVHVVGGCELKSGRDLDIAVDHFIASSVLRGTGEGS